jgi:hypothetical protein
MDILTIPQPKPFVNPPRIEPAPFSIVNLTEDTIEVKMGDDDTIYKWEGEATIKVKAVDWASSHALARLQQEGVLAVVDEDKAPKYRTRRLGEYACDSWRNCCLTDCPFVDSYRWDRPKKEEDLHPVSRKRLDACPKARKGQPVTRRLADKSDKEEAARSLRDLEVARENELVRLVEKIEKESWFDGWSTDGGKLALKCRDLLTVHPGIIVRIKGEIHQIERYLADRDKIFPQP